MGCVYSCSVIEAINASPEQNQQPQEDIITKHYKDFIELHSVVGVIGFFNNDQLYETFNQYLALVHHIDPINFKTFIQLPKHSHHYLKTRILDKILDGYSIVKVVIMNSKTYDTNDNTNESLINDITYYLSISGIELDPAVLNLYMEYIGPDVEERLQKLSVRLEAAKSIMHKNVSMIEDYYTYYCEKCEHNIDNCLCEATTGETDNKEQ